MIFTYVSSLRGALLLFPGTARQGRCATTLAPYASAVSNPLAMVELVSPRRHGDASGGRAPPSHIVPEWGMTG